MNYLFPDILPVFSSGLNCRLDLTLFPEIIVPEMIYNFVQSIRVYALPRTSFPVGLYPNDALEVSAPDMAGEWVLYGYQAEIFMKDLIWPSSIEFDDAGNIYGSLGPGT